MRETLMKRTIDMVCVMLGVLLFTICFGVVGVTVHAQSNIIPEDAFDYNWYLEQHPDLYAIYGNNHALIYQFYRTTGLAAGWNGRIALHSLLSPYDFDYREYLTLYPEVVTKLDVAVVLRLREDDISGMAGECWRFTTEGYYEFKPVSWNFYEEDLMTYGTLLKRIYDYYLQVGYYEGKIPSGYANVLDSAKGRIYQVADSITTPTMSGYDKVKAVHDWMLLNISYDYNNYLNGTIPWESFHIEGAMRYGKAVCNGYAETFDEFMRAVGMDSHIVYGAEGFSHAWNRVRIDGVWRNIDVTWDDPVPDEIGRTTYTYFLVSDERILQDHGWDPAGDLKTEASWGW